MRAIVFGATGFFGSHVVEQLVAAGHEAVAVVRPSSSRAHLESVGAVVLSSDFSDDALVEASRSADVVFNCTADTRLHLDHETRRAVEIVLTERIIRAASSAGVGRYVQLSSVQSYGTDLPAEAVDEEHPCRPLHDYQLVTLEREDTVKRVADEVGLDWVIGRPVTSTGARDTSLMKNLYPVHRSGRFPVFGEGNLPITVADARDVGRAMLLLGESAEASRGVFLIGGFACSWLEIKEAMDRATGRTTKTLHLPVRPMRALARVLTALTPRNREPFLHPLAVDTSSRPSAFDDSRLRALGYAPQHGLDDAIGSAVAWIRAIEPGRRG